GIHAPSPVPQALPGAYAATDLSRSARIDLATAPSRTYFLFTGPVLRFGRAKPGRGGSQNDVVLRVLPCRSPQIDPDNFYRTNQISGHHGELLLKDECALIVDSSRSGIWLDGRRLKKGIPTPLPRAFKLSVSGVLELQGQMYPPDAPPRSPIEAIRLLRIENFEEHVYVWVITRAGLGPYDAIQLAAEAGEIRVVDSQLRLGAGSHEAPLCEGPLDLAGTPCYVGGATGFDQVDRPFR
ncbi:FHA domain-containing protein, partial [Planctomycetota bacterium]